MWDLPFDLVKSVYPFKVVLISSERAYRVLRRARGLKGEEIRLWSDFDLEDRPKMKRASAELYGLGTRGEENLVIPDLWVVNKKLIPEEPSAETAPPMVPELVN